MIDVVYKIGRVYCDIDTYLTELRFFRSTGIKYKVKYNYTADGKIIKTLLRK